MKIVILDAKAVNPGDLSWECLSELGELIIYEETDQRNIIERIEDAEAVFITNLVLNREIMNSCPHLKYIGILATGMDMVDLEAANELGITVQNVSGYGTEAVSQFAFALLFEICHQIGMHNESVHAGEWGNTGSWRYWKSPQLSLFGKTLGIIGYGAIGHRSAEIARAFGMKVCIYQPDKNISEIEKEKVNQVSLEQLWKESDVIFLHCPLTQENRNLICQETIKKMKDGVILINNARGGLVNSKDLAKALRTGKVYAAGLDVSETEPIRNDNPLLREKNCILTPHISWAGIDARKRLIRMAAEHFRYYLKIQGGEW